MKTIYKLAVAALLAVSVGGLLFTMLRSPTVAFADVLKNVKAAKGVTFQASGMVPVPGRPAMQVKSKNWITDTGRMRQVIEPGGMIMIVDWHAGKWLTLEPASKRAIIMEMANAPAQAQGNLLDSFKALDAKAGTPIGPKEIAGHKTQGFKVSAPTMDMTIWADTQTHLPVEVEQTLKLANIPPATMTFTDFVWNADIDESLVSLTPPAGYSVQTTTLNMAPANEKDLIEALKAAASLNDNHFPDAFDTAGVVRGMARQMAQAKPGSPQQKEQEQKSLQAMSVVARGWLFMNDPKNGEDWHYAGKDVEQGKAGVPILWYRPKGAATYRVIDADLTVHEAQPNALPGIPSVPMGPPPTTSPTTAPSPAAK